MKSDLRLTEAFHVVILAAAGIPRGDSPAAQGFDDLRSPASPLMLGGQGSFIVAGEQVCSGCISMAVRRLPDRPDDTGATA